MSVWLGLPDIDEDMKADDAISDLLDEADQFDTDIETDETAVKDALKQWDEDIKSEEKDQKAEKEKPLMGCSAFIATGNATFDGRIVMAHNTWAPYFIAVKFNLILFIKPE